MTEDLSSSLPDLLQRARLKCPRASAALYRAFGGHVLEVAQSCLSRRVWPKVGPEDVAQQVWLEFFGNVPGPERFETPRHLQGWLVTITRRRACDVNRRFLKHPTHNVRRECCLDDLLCEHDVGGLSVGPRPLWGEDLEDLQALQGDALQLSKVERKYALLLWYGASLRLIAVHAGVSGKTVRRVLGGLARRGGIYEMPAADRHLSAAG